VYSDVSVSLSNIDGPFFEADGDFEREAEGEGAVLLLVGDLLEETFDEVGDGEDFDEVEEGAEVLTFNSAFCMLVVGGAWPFPFGTDSRPSRPRPLPSLSNLALCAPVYLLVSVKRSNIVPFLSPLGDFERVPLPVGVLARGPSLVGDRERPRSGLKLSPDGSASCTLLPSQFAL